MSNDVKSRILEVVCECVNNIPEDTAFNLREAGIIDSLSMMNIMASLEDEFDIEFDPKDMTKDNFASIDTMSELVSRYLD